LASPSAIHWYTNKLACLRQQILQQTLCCLLLWCISLIASASIQNQAVIELTGDMERISANEHVELHVDQEGAATLAEILKLHNRDWQLNSTGTINFGQSPHPYWFHVRLNGLDQLRQRTYLHLDYPSLDKIDVFLVRDEKILQHYHTGDTTPFVSRPIEHRAFLFPLNDPHGAVVDVYLRAATEGPLQVPLNIITESALSKEDNALSLWFGAYFGIMLVMLLYNGLIFAFVRDFSYFFYLIYISSTTLLQFTLEGFGHQYFWPRSSTLNNTMLLMPLMWMIFSAISFAWYFIGMRELGNRLEKTAIKLIYFGVGVGTVGIFTMSYMAALKLSHTLSIITVLFGFYLGLKYWINGVKAARIFTLAWFIYLIFMLINIAYFKGYIQPDFMSVHALEIGSVIELVLLSLAFADRLNAEKELRLSAQIKRNEDLDLLVRERTEELEAANQKLQEVSITDGLTGLYNRRHFDEVYASEYQRAFREKHALAVIMVDLDHFKKINDTYGHPFGDLCLREAATVILNAIRRPPDLAARYGGEEFAVLLPATTLAGAAHVAETIRHTLEITEVSDGNHRIYLSASVGVGCEVPSERNSQAALLQRVDSHLYRAKHGGRNQVVSD